MSFENNLDFAKQLDEKDELKSFRSKFFIPQHEGKDTVYFTGNSLGLQPKSTLAYIQQELNDWALFGVEGHFHAKNPWLSYHEIFPKLLAPIVGAMEDELVVMNQLTINLHLLMVSFYQPTKERYKIICEAKAFPSDQYALESQVKFHGLNYADAVIEVAPREGEYTIRLEDILSTIEQHKDSVALVLFGGVNYYTGQVFDMPTIVKATHAVGALCGFDLAHAAGNVELKLHDWNVDFACWCSYKYMNSGYRWCKWRLYIKNILLTKHCNVLLVGGVIKKSTRFKMDKGFEPIPTAEGWQLSNAPVLSMAAHKASLDILKKLALIN
jgi:kynureninase